MLIESPLIYRGQQGKYQNLVGLAPDGRITEVTSNEEDGMASVINRRFGTIGVTSQLFRIPASSVLVVENGSNEKILRVSIPDTF